LSIKQTNINKILIIQTAFVGDVILATGLSAKLKKFFPESKISFLVRKGNEALISENSSVDHVLVWDKRNSKYVHLIRLIREVRRENFDLVVNVQRHFSTGLITVLSQANMTIGFKSNPLSKFFTKSVLHEFPSITGIHEIQRNNELIASLTDDEPQRPVLKFSADVKLTVEKYKLVSYVTIAPASVWETKQFPSEKWSQLIDKINPDLRVFLIGAPEDVSVCEEITKNSCHNNISILAGELTLEQTAVLIKDAFFSFVNDSAPLHIASAYNTPVCSIFCSTLPEFGFYPLSDISVVIEIEEKLYCRPCGLHGKKSCPEKHFKCGVDIEVSSIIGKVNAALKGIFIDETLP